jgi:hypothetical protein
MSCPGLPGLVRTSPPQVIPVTVRRAKSAASCVPELFLSRSLLGTNEVPYMPILFMALIALAVFLIMGAMVFYAAYSESHTTLTQDVTEKVQDQGGRPAAPAAVPPIPTVMPAPSPSQAMGKAAGRS